MCLDEPILIRLVSGEGSDAERQEWLEHVAGCARCRERHEALQQTWTILGVWQEQAPHRSLAESVLAAAAREGTRRQAADRAASPRRGWGLIAASVLLAGGAGWLAGRFSAAPPAAPSPVAVSVEQAGQSIGLESLSGEGVIATLFSELPPSDPADSAGGSS